MTSWASSGGQSDSVSTTHPAIAAAWRSSAERTWSESMVIVLARPVSRSRPVTSARVGLVVGKTRPNAILSSSAVRSPIAMPKASRTQSWIAWSRSKPPTRIARLTTTPPREMTATSVLPPPMSTIIDPTGSSTGMLAPMAAAMGSSIRYTRPAPACLAASRRAERSTLVTPLGTEMSTRDRLNRPTPSRSNSSRSIREVITKSVTAPPDSGRSSTAGWVAARTAS